MKKNILLGFISFIIFSSASIYISFPLILHMTDFANGEYVIAWIMNWNIHAIIHAVWPFFDANIFYPYHNTLAYSDLFLSSSVLALPFFLIFHEPMLPSNITFLSSLILLGFFTYLLTFYITKNFFASLLSGFLIIFSPVVLDKRYHLQILAIEWIPLSLLFFFHFIKKHNYKFLLISLFFFVMQTYNSFMAGYFLVFSYIGLVINYFLFDKKSFSKFATTKTVLFFLLSFLMIIPIVIPYYRVSNQFLFVRDIRETIHLALQPEDLLVTNDMSKLKTFLWFFDSHEYPPSAEIKPGFLGLTFSLLALFSIFYVFKIFFKDKKHKNLLSVSFLSVGFFGLILSLGPALHIDRHTIHHPFLIPLPYALAYYLFPGFQGIRDSSRFEILFVILMAVVIGLTLDKVLKNKAAFFNFLIYFILLIVVVAEFGKITYDMAAKFENFPKVYSWINSYTPENAAIAEMPIYNWDNNPLGENREVLREYYSTIHFRRLISGGSGFSPPPWQKFAQKEFIQFPSNRSIEEIEKYGANYLIVHSDEFDILNRKKYMAGTHIVYSGEYVLSALSKNPHLKFIIKIEGAYVYKFI